MTKRLHRAYLEAARIFAEYESKFAPYTMAQIKMIVDESPEGNARGLMEMLYQAKEWRMKFEDPDVLAACNAKDEELNP